MKTIYEALTDAGVQLDNHYSDLYALATEDCIRIVAEYRKGATIGPVSTFISNIDGKRWYDIPFAYMPYWADVERKCAARSINARG